MADKRDVTGVWYGRYEAEHWDEKNGFIAVLDELGGAIGGTITERETRGRPGTRRALVTGRRDGTLVRFVKQYDGTGGHVHAVNYSGRIDGEGLEIGGAWTLAGGWGRFVMEREKFDAAELEAEDEVGLPVG
jgi:hypothetical protein